MLCLVVWYLLQVVVIRAFDLQKGNKEPYFQVGKFETRESFVLRGDVLDPTLCISTINRSFTLPAVLLTAIYLGLLQLRPLCLGLDG